ncbi:MAG: NAD(P)/FAD-dependent oxidoreductase [Sulfurimonas sp.]|nr:NAD(P)/FAD-dependent oxidoreductase [Sulfurimonas sp.]
MKKVAIIGGGASGLLCSLLCLKASLHVDIYEQNEKCAKKILVSGNGRCNITNTSLSSADYYSQNPDFVSEALNLFGYKEFEKFTQSIGLIIEEKNDGKCYPLSNEAKSVASLLISTAQNLGVNFHTQTKITDIKKLLEEYDAVVVATGSEAASHLGGNRDGGDFALEFGHTLVPSYPSLVQLELDSSFAHKMSGAKVDGEVNLLINNKLDSSYSGDILFTNYGVSGFAILDISQLASEAIMNYQAVDIRINLLPKYTAQKLSNYILQIYESNKSINIENILHGLLPIKIVKVLLLKLELPVDSTINTKLSKKIANQILNWKFEVKDTHGFRHAEVAGGGVNVDEINPKTMESLKQKNLYFCGEVLDVLGRRGGFNFAWAWASAYSAAHSIIKS